ncbi:cytosol aminopeptidase-like [Falco peregrinus]|uniref:cytosol aminopeptidase-like n=1 Tax=Falco peregrinus TaxID=8954 RepID=UPI00247A33EE|nr:cytosol aminopeptidase-like [Falco peregrinus]
MIYDDLNRYRWSIDTSITGGSNKTWAKRSGPLNVSQNIMDLPPGTPDKFENFYVTSTLQPVEGSKAHRRTTAYLKSRGWEGQNLRSKSVCVIPLKKRCPQFIYSLCQEQAFPRNGLASLCENMPSSKANEPGDVVRAKNGKPIQVDNTDAERRLLLADALCYAHNFNARATVNAATLTGVMAVALGSAVTGVFTNSPWLWTHLYEVSILTGDRVWRMPLFEHYAKQVTDCPLADLSNIGKYSRAGGACTAAAFLKEFVNASHWAHLDIAGVMSNKDEVPYLRKGMAGQPTRTLVEFAARLSQESHNTKLNTYSKITHSALRKKNLKVLSVNECPKHIFTMAMNYQMHFISHYLGKNISPLRFVTSYYAI